MFCLIYDMDFGYLFLYNKNNERTIKNEVMEIKEGVILWKKRDI